MDSVFIAARAGVDENAAAPSATVAGASSASLRVIVMGTSLSCEKLRKLGAAARKCRGEVAPAIGSSRHDLVLEAKLCQIKSDPRAVLFGLEKFGAVQLTDTAKDILTDESRSGNAFGVRTRGLTTAADPRRFRRLRPTGPRPETSSMLKFLALIGLLAILAGIGTAAFFFGGFYSV